MRLWRVLLHGKNFPGYILGQSAPISFYATRFVEAESEPEAEIVAVASLREDEALQVPHEHRNIEAQVFAESVVEVEASTPRVPNAGFTFYPVNV